MFLTKWFILFIFLLPVIYGCNVCVNEKLLTTAVKCPICDPCDGKSVIPGVEDSVFGRVTNGNQCFPLGKPCNVTDKYRSFDGSCNNLENPTWGMTQTPYIRLLPYNYGDDNYTIAPASNGDEKPLVRVLSTTFFPDKGSNDNQASLMTMQWGQLIAHDTLITFPQDENGSCCNLVGDEKLDESCLPIENPPDDPFYSQFNVTCIEKRRNVVTNLNYCCKEGGAQQVNSVSHIIDGSMIYGSTLEIANSLREFNNGAMKHQLMNDGKEFLPNAQARSIIEVCVATESKKCFVAGDARVNQNTQLTALQTLLLREHNRIANELYELHPKWDDEKLYQESRAIVVAILQHITYSEWLALYVGEANMAKHKLKLTSGAYTKYMDTVKPIVINSFSSSVYRFPHSGMQGALNMANDNGEVEDRVDMSDWLNRPCILTQYNNLDRFLLGLVFQPMQSFGDHYTKKMTTKMFNFPAPYGQDLASIDIIRGRDNGLAPYIHYLEMCTDHKVNNFDDLKKYIDVSKIEKLKKVYKNVIDIDLFVGAALEKMVSSTRLGPTNLCVTLEQFYRLKWGDRFWYENEKQPHSLSFAQMLEIKKVTLARLLCDNGDNITRITKKVFLIASKSNKIVKCDTIKKINLSKWS